MENLEALDGRFVVLWDCSAVRIHDAVSRDSNPAPISLAREHLNTRPLGHHPTLSMPYFKRFTEMTDTSTNVFIE